MSNQETKVSLSAMLQGHAVVPGKVVAQTNHRIKGVMKDAVRNFQKKQRASLEKASQIVLNA